MSPLDVRRPLNGTPYQDATPSSTYSPGTAGWRSIAGGGPEGCEGPAWPGCGAPDGCGAGVFAGGCVAALCFAQPATVASTKIIVSVSRAKPVRSLRKPSINCMGSFSGRLAGLTQFPDSQLFSHFGII